MLLQKNHNLNDEFKKEINKNEVKTLRTESIFEDLKKLMNKNLDSSKFQNNILNYRNENNKYLLSSIIYI